MKLISSSTSITFGVAIASTLISLSSPFVIQPQTSTTSSTTKLFISSWGLAGPPSRWKEEIIDPSEKIVAYLKEPEPVLPRSNLDGTVLVSGWVDSTERTDQTVFDLLNDVEDTAFRFKTISAFVNDAKFAKKRLISRSARYTGLLDKFNFVEAEEKGGLPTKEQLDGVQCWVANASNGADGLTRIKAIVERAAEVSSTLENLSILVTGGQEVQDAQEMKNTVDDLKKTCEENDIAFTLIVLGAISESAEGFPYEIVDFHNENTTDAQLILPSNATYSRDEGLRLVTHIMGMDSGKNKALVFKEMHDVNATESKLIRGLREGGYSRSQEIDHMLTKGPVAYEQACEDFKVKNPYSSRGTVIDAEWLAERQKEEDLKDKERDERMQAKYDAKKEEEIEGTATEWAKREYYRKSTQGDMTLSEDEYVKSVWERAIHEGEVKYLQNNGIELDEEQELIDFKQRQEKKKKVMLERAKASLQELIDEDDDDEDDDE